GRWHTAGRPIVYLAEHPALCLLEVLAHDVSTGDLPRSYQWLKVEADRSMRIRSVGDLPDDWRSDRASTRAVGDRWLAESRTPLLKVPSVVAPESWNYLLNPAHARAHAVRVTTRFSYPLDRRFARVFDQKSSRS
ncbi:MAG: RES family NAD+ phosphorylase, partial [Candidatus Binatia bacterium]